VSGVGCVYTNDDIGDFRLTTAVNPEIPKYWEETILLYRDLVTQYPNLSPRYRAIARRSLASAYWRLGRLYWKSGRLAKTALQLPKVGSTDPLFALSLVIHRRSDANYQPVLPDYS
jgi:hypothetical protein